MAESKEKEEEEANAERGPAKRGLQHAGAPSTKPSDRSRLKPLFRSFLARHRPILALTAFQHRRLTNVVIGWDELLDCEMSFDRIDCILSSYPCALSKRFTVYNPASCSIHWSLSIYS